MLLNDPLWYKDAIIYQVHLRAFQDADGDGMGDFKGLTQKLDYLQDLGVTAIWALPFYPSPLKDDGYDIADYTNIHPDYGTLRDFRNFLQEAHGRGLRVITELVINHTSDQHPWFQRARRAPPGSPERNFYVWSDNADKYRDARIIFKDFEQSNWTWDPLAKAYFWHRFYSHQPDLNYDNPEVWKAIFPVLDFWMSMGVDGMRLDAVPYLYEREGTTCENLPETHQFLQALRKHVDEKFSQRMLLAEANQWPEDAVAYFAAGTECHMAFHFPVMPRMFMAIQMEDRFPILDIMAQTPAIPENCQWCMFLRNHDELTLEMVTDEERDYMYRAYASEPRARINMGIRRRLAPLMGNNRRRIELMNALLFSLPGTPVIYYGDEIGMGDNFYLGDRNGVRTPMQWSADRNAGFSHANPQKLYLPVIIDPEYHYESVNVEAQQNNPNSLLWYMKRLMALRKRHKAFGRGTLEFLQPENRKILAFLRRFQDECLLVITNLSRFVQYVELDLSAFVGQTPVELFGGNPFPAVGRAPYVLTLGPHSFYWLALVAQAAPERLAGEAGPRAQLPVIAVAGGWEEVFTGSGRDRLEEILSEHLAQRRWFGSKARRIKSTEITQDFRVTYGEKVAHICLVRVEFSEGAPETYLLPLAFAAGEPAVHLLEESPQAVAARVQGETEGLLFDALIDLAFGSMLLEAVRGNRPFEEPDQPQLVATAFPLLEPWLQQTPEASLTPAANRADQTNSSIIYGGRVMAKIFRRVEEGINPDLELGRYLSERKVFPYTPPTLGAVELRRRRAEPTTLAVLQGYVANEADAWRYTLDELSLYFERIVTRLGGPPTTFAVQPQGNGEAAPLAHEVIGPYLDRAALLGRRTGELHLALSADTEDPAFAPEPFSKLYQRSLYQSMRNLIGQVFSQMRRRLPAVPDAVRERAQQVLDMDTSLISRFHFLLERRLAGQRIRCHGDYHLGQVLFTGKDFVIIDFEGEPARSITERRIKRSPLRDVAGMVRSFHYAAYSALLGQGGARGRSPGLIRAEDVAASAPWAYFWYQSVSSAFLQAYRQVVAATPLLPADPDEFRLLLGSHLLEKAIYELGYEMNHRPDWVQIPVLGILELVRGQEAAASVTPVQTAGITEGATR
jgi:maltose alpha-D-glucosyltransferase/alpha-amylase